jgi:predicted membrane protein
MKVSDFDLRCGANEVSIQLPEAAGHTRVAIRGGMGTIRIHVPEKVAARISLSTGMSDITIDETRFPMRGGVYESPDFPNAANKVEIRIRAGMSSLQIT